MKHHPRKVLTDALSGQRCSDEAAHSLADFADTESLMEVAGRLCVHGHGQLVTYSKKVFIPLTQLCRDVCHYCTFARVPRRLEHVYLPLEQVVEIARRGAAAGCKEALFTLGEKPERRYRIAREALADMGYETTLDYLAAAAATVYRETGLLPHLNPGTLSAQELQRLRPLAPSMGMMLESTSERLLEKGMPHHGSVDKVPAVRLATLEAAGVARIPFTTGILIGIGETRLERIESLLAIRAMHERHGHIQEVIVQNFRAKPDTRMARAPEPDLDELLWTLAVARILFGARMNIQAPPNLSSGSLSRILAAGINDWGGVSPLTPDYVNPEAPWPHLGKLAAETRQAGKYLDERLTIYPQFARDLATWTDPAWHAPILQRMDADGRPRTDEWLPGAMTAPPPDLLCAESSRPGLRIPSGVARILAAVGTRDSLTESEIVYLLRARGAEYDAVCQAADDLRAQTCGAEVSFVVNRNINYTNICYYKCRFCAFSKGKLSENLRGRPYDLSKEEIQRRVREAWERGATEVCMQGGIHPDYTGRTYLQILEWVREACPKIHIHAFSPLEVWQGAATLEMPLDEYLRLLKAAGLGTLPGTAAEILDDEVRAVICPDKIDTAQWLEVMTVAHRVGFRSTATIMYGHVDHYRHWARHLLRVRALQEHTGGFTEFVPLPFVHMEAPLYLKGQARKGPTFREAVLLHAVARLVLHPLITNIQASWVKMGHDGVEACLRAGCNDLGGTLMNESITRAAGAAHGQETSPQAMRQLIMDAGRIPVQRTTLYAPVDEERIHAAQTAVDLAPIINTRPQRTAGRKRSNLLPVINRLTGG